MTRVIIADDHPLMVSGIVSVLRGTRYEVVATASDGTALLGLLPDAAPDVLIVDIAMPGATGMEILRKLRAAQAPYRVVLLTANISDAQLMEAIELEVDGIIHKEVAVQQLLACLDSAMAGRKWMERAMMQRAVDIAMKGDQDKGVLSGLTPRERSIAQLTAQGLRNKEVARELGLTDGTVRVCLHRIYEKLVVTNRTELALLLNRASGDRA